MEASIPDGLEPDPLVLDQAVEPATSLPADPVPRPVTDAPSFVPTLEDLAQDWLGEPTDTEGDTSFADGSGGLDMEELASRADEATPAPVAIEESAWAQVDTTTEFSASAVARMQGRTAASASASSAPFIDDFSPDASRFRRSRWVGLGLIVVALAAGVAFVMSRPPAATAEDEVAAGDHDTPSTAAEPSAPAEPTAPADQQPVSPVIDDGLVVVRFEVGLPGVGKTCDGDRRRFSRDEDRKIAACYVVEQPHQTDRVIVMWEKQAETVRRGVKEAPRAARLVSRSFLSLHEQPTGPWRVRLMRDDGGTLTELARRQIVIDP